jgi:hypothetical protein
MGQSYKIQSSLYRLLQLPDVTQMHKFCTFLHPAAEAVGTLVSEMPYKCTNFARSYIRQLKQPVQPCSTYLL